MTLDDASILVIRPGHRLQWEERQHSWVLLFPEGMITLNDTARLILDQFRQPTRISVALAALEARFPDQPIRADVLDFLRDAHDQHWLQPA